MIRLLIILLLLIQPAPDPRLRAWWDGNGRATIEWTQQTRGCLSVQHATNERAFLSCYEKPGSYRIELGHVGPLSGDLRPAAGDVYTLQTGGQKYSAPLRGRLVYFPVFRG
jgi:hypothetical protein